MANFSLTETESEVVAFKGEVEKSEEGRVKLSLMAKLLTNKIYNTRALKKTMEMLWRPAKGLMMKEVGGGTLAFQFFLERDRSWVLERQPWSFNGSLLMLKEIQRGEAPEEIRFEKSPFWVQIYNVPFERRCEAVAASIGGRIGKFLEMERGEDYGWSEKMKIRVNIDISKPLPRGIKMKFGSKDPIWLSVKYLHLPDFCYKCGCMGHVEKDCEMVRGEEVENGGEQYGGWLRDMADRYGWRDGGEEKVKENQRMKELIESYKEKPMLETSEAGDAKNQNKATLIPGTSKGKTNEEVIIVAKERNLGDIAGGRLKEVSNEAKEKSKAPREEGQLLDKILITQEEEKAENELKFGGKRWKRKAREVGNNTDAGNTNQKPKRKHMEMNDEMEIDALEGWQGKTRRTSVSTETGVLEAEIGKVQSRPVQ